MRNNTAVVFDNRSRQSARLAVLIPVRDDMRIHNLLASLQPQANDQVHVLIINDKQPDSFIKELPAPIQGAILHHRGPCRLGEKINMLWDFANAEWLAVLESDAILHRNWVQDVFKIMEHGNVKSVHLGGELFEKNLILNNCIFKKDDDYFPRHVEQTGYANDAAWFMECERRGIPVVKHRLEAIVFHDNLEDTQNYRIGWHLFAFRKNPLYPKSSIRYQMGRLFTYVKDSGYLAAIYPKSGIIQRRILGGGYFFVHACFTFLFLFFMLYFTIKNWLTRKKRI